VSLQVAILKVLASYAEGQASLKALNADLAILNTSGPDWSNRTKRLAAWVPDLDIFSQGFVLRNEAGWQITDEGRSFLIALETSDRLTRRPNPEPVALESNLTPAPLPPPQLLLIGVKRRRPKARRGRFADPRRRTA
jgi:hypothetical protein